MSRCEPAIVYARKSHTRQARQGRREISIADQLRELRDEAEAYGVEIAAEFTDNASAWTPTTREGWDAALAALDAPDAPRVLYLHAIDRMSRQGGYTPFAEELKRRIARGQLRVIGLLDDYDSARYRDPETAANELDKLLIEARRYSDKLAKRIRAAKTRTRLAGGFVGKAPYGMKLDDTETRRLMRGDNWDVVERVFTATVEGLGARRVAAALNAEGIPAPRGGQWTSRTIATIINNPAYMGHQTRREGPRTVSVLDDAGSPVLCVAPGEQLIPAELWHAANRAARSRAFISTGKAALLTGRLVCDGCGGPMSSGGTGYRCSRHSKGRPCPAPATAQMNALDEYVLWRASNAVAALDPDDPEDRDHLATLASVWAATMRPPEDTAAITNAEMAVRDAEKVLKRVQRNARWGVYDDDEPGLERDLKAARETLAAARARLDELTGSTTLVLPEWAGWWSGPEVLAAWRDQTPEMLKKILATVVAEVRVIKAGRGANRLDTRRVYVRFVWEPA
ncbi:site-specific recombinase [Actinomadura rubrobrunea]|uniref:Site-specific recombinase n=1 Tax=Actinomadura rubrobrunea TaxID=115335 RepID=A0A9W6UV40_9ACTN|nr:recombinase family protein [Actinomadura rubrobrunea]GLW63528.1 site-specific recombinase [Actinomadura rubrobrunea]